MKIKKKMTPPLLVYDPVVHGVTAGLLEKFMACRELTRLHLRRVTSHYTSEALSFGTFTHAILEHVYERHATIGTATAPEPQAVTVEAIRLFDQWKKENPMARAEAIEDTERIVMMAEAVLQEYFLYWAQKDAGMTWKKAEYEFKLPWTVTSPKGQPMQTFLRGKIDAWYYPKNSKRPGLFETKTKTRIVEGSLIDILAMNRQANIYLQALHTVTGRVPDELTYNIIRRPSLRQKTQESFAQFRVRLIEDIRNRKEFYFFRLKMQMEPKDLAQFKIELNGMISDFLMWWHGEAGHYKNGDHCENKYGMCPMVPICSNQDYTNHFTRDVIFRELSDG